MNNFYLFFLLFMSSFLMFSLFLITMMYKYMLFLEWEILFFNSFSMEMIIFIDWKSMMFLSVVFLISSMVFLYSMEYMHTKMKQFSLLIFLFVMSMMLFIISPNLISILLGWDGLGLVSYILIIFFQSKKSKNSGMLTLLLNRIGDIMIIIASWFFLSAGGSMNFIYYEFWYMKLGMYMIIIASMTKSAQVPFSSWLPAAMAAPTPVSSLVHSSTLVTAGIYLMLRFNMYFYMSKYMLKFILMMSALTMLISGMAANMENDFKKIIALSTLSQLGLMMMTLSMGLTTFSFFHLSTHALFKALLFLCAGVLIHNMKDNQDIRLMGHMMYYMPVTMICFITANMSLCGFPFMSGFYSKDLIIEYSISSSINFFLMLTLFLSTSLTMSYTLRLLFFMSFLNKNYFFMMKKLENIIFNSVLLIITTFSLIIGSILFWMLFNLMFIFHMNEGKKTIIPMIMVIGMMMTIFTKEKKMHFFSSLMFFYITTSSMKKIPFKYIKPMFLTVDLGFLEYFGLQGMTFFLKMKIENSMLSLSFKTTIMVSMMYMLLMMM